MQMIQLNKIDMNRYSEDEDGVATIHSVPVMINVDAIRCYYARKENRPGTRLTFTDRGGFAVTDTVDEVSAKIGLAAV